MAETHSSIAPTDATRDLDRSAQHHRTALPDGGQMKWRVWGKGPNLTLLHGGHGSWMHWAAVIPELATRWTLVVPDLPGFGESDDIPGKPPIETIADAVASGLSEIVPDGPIHLTGFSFGGVLGGHVGRELGDRLRQFVIVGSNGMGLTRPPMEKLSNWKKAPPDEQDDIHRRNLEILMISPTTPVTDEMIAIQRTNTIHARGRSRSFSVTTTLADILLSYHPPTDGIWGADDATSKGHLAERRDFLAAVDPASTYIEIPNAGHWVAMDRPVAFIDALETVLAKR